jgi:methyltransferase
LAISVKLYLLLIVLLYAERLLELVISRRNVRRAVALGSREVGRGHFGLMVLFHALFPAAAAMEVLLLHRPFPGVWGFVALAVALLAQGLRWWAVSSLGPAWNVRIVVIPDAEPITRGPYRVLRHPNYLAVVLEMLALPLIHGAWLTAAVASVVNGLLLRVRIPAEEAALGPLYSRAFAGRPRLLPGGRRE